MRRHLLATCVLALVFGYGLISWQVIGPGASVPEVASPGIAREDFTVRFGSFQARAQLTYPEFGVAPFPLVILVAGSGPADMDVTIAGQDGAIEHRLFRDISDHLTRHGYATVRYNKRYVKSATVHPAEGDYAKKVTPADLQGDFERIYAHIVDHPRIDRARIVVYGWSEGTMIATGAALAHPEIAGLILHAPIARTYKAIDRYQLIDLGVPFLRDVVDTDRDGAVNMAEIEAASSGELGAAPQSIVGLLTETRWRGRMRFRPEFDRDGDGQLGIGAEVEPLLADFFDTWDAHHTAAGHEAYTTTAQPPPIAQRLPGYPGSILLLHGERDGNVPADDSRQIAAVLTATGHDDLRVRIYPGLGHSLGPAADRYRDGLAPIAPAVLLDVIVWLDDHFDADGKE